MTALIFIVGTIVSCDGPGKTQPLSESEIEKLHHEGMSALSHSDVPKARAIGKKLLDIARRDSSELAAIYGNTIYGQSVMFDGNNDSAFVYLHKAEMLCRRFHNYSMLASVYNGLGLYSANVENDLSGALKYYFNGLDAAEKSGNERLYSLLLANISSIYALTSDPAGLLYSRECYNRGKEKDDRFLLYTGAANLAYTYALTKKDFEKGLEYVVEAEQILNEDSIRYGGPLYYTYGILLLQAGRDAEAEACFKESIARTRDNDNDGDVRAYVEYAKILTKRGEAHKALKLLEGALAAADSVHSRIFRSDLVNAIAATHRKLGNESKAREALRIAANEDSVSKSADKSLMIAHLKNKYDLERADNEMNRQQVEILKKERLLYWLLGIIGFAAILIIVYIYFYRKKSKLYRAIVIQFTETAREEQHLRAALRQLEREKAEKMEKEPDGGESIETDTKENKGEGVAKDTDEKFSKLAIEFENLISNPSVYTDNDISQDKIARMLGTNRTYLSIMVKQVYRMNFTQFINSLRIKEAVRRLGDPSSEVPLKALSSELGYNSMTTFYSKFNEATGMTPAAFRSKARSIKKPD